MLPPRLLKKWFIAATILTVLIVYFPRRHRINAKVYYHFYPKESVQCYHRSENCLADISESQPLKGRSIFFHETSCNSHYAGKIYIHARQACAVESAAKLNPNYQVYLLFASPGVLWFNGTESDRFLQALLSYENVRVRHVDFEKYTRGTPVERLYREGEIDWSGYAQSHASDVLRYLTLWKYGGIYLDLDVVVTKTLEDLPPNFAGSESDRNVAAGVLGFDWTGQGHQLAQMCLEDLRADFRGHEWGHNGPGVITRLLKTICGVEEAKDMVDRDCRSFKVYPPETFYPIRWQDWEKYFDESAAEDVEDRSKLSRAVHVWNKHSVDTRIPVGSKAPYAFFAREYCPRVFRECEEYF